MTSNNLIDITAHNKKLKQLFDSSEITTLGLQHTNYNKIGANGAHQNDLIKNRFVLIEHLGAGGMGEVFRAKDLVRERMQDSSPYVALKLLKSSLIHVKEAVQALQSEAKKAQSLSHPNIVTVYDFDIDGDTPFLTMAYLPGQSLHDYLKTHGPMPYNKAMQVIEQVARGLAYAHQEGFVHADIKPSNIYLEHGGNVKILDLGIAIAFRDTQKTSAERLTESALTPAYASPQMLAGDRPLPSDDVYSLCVVAYMLLKGKHPFLNEKGHAIPSNKAREQQLVSPEIQGISRRHLRALKKGLAFTREKRFLHAGELIDAIKPRNIKKDLLILTVAGALTSAGIFSAQFSLQQVIPTVHSLPADMSKLKYTIKEGDDVLALGDLARAHTLYSHAKEELEAHYNPLDQATEDAREILYDRRKKIIHHLVKAAENRNASALNLKETTFALEVILLDDFTEQSQKIRRSLKKIKKNLAQKGH